MPKTVTVPDVLRGTAAGRVWRSAFLSGFDGTCKDSGERREECSARVAWSAVKGGFRKNAEGNWVKKNEASVEMYITKVSKDKQSGVRRWFATASGTKFDRYDERMSVALFKDFINRIEGGEAVPEPFSSEAWNGGLPYLSISHYHDLDGFGITGITEQMWIDGKMLKARGTFADTELARTAYERIRQDIKDNMSEDQRVRISIAFIDFGHEHEGFGTFRRKALSDSCDMCERDLKNKVYTHGQLVHLALTRRPAYPETEFGLEERSMTTRKDDAESIVGEEFAEELDERQMKLVGRSAEDIDPGAIVRKDKHKNTHLDDEDEDEEEDMSKKKKVKKAQHGHPPGQRPGGTKEPDRGVKATGTEPEERMLGGAATLDEAEEYLTEKGVSMVLDSWGILVGVLDNATGGEYLEEIQRTVQDFQSLIDVQTANALNTVAQLLEQGDTMEERSDETEQEQELDEGLADEAEATPLEDSFSELQTVISKVQEGDGTSDDKLREIHPTFTALADAIREQVSGEAVQRDAADPADLAEVVNEALAQQLAPIAKELEAIRAGKAVERSEPVSPLRRSVRASVDSSLISKDLNPPPEPEADPEPTDENPTPSLRKMIARTVDPRLG